MKLYWTLILVIISFNLFSLSWDDYIGMTPKSLIESIGSPDQVLTERGGHKKEDDVVFFYPDRSYYYFNLNRIWQVRFDKKYEGDILGFKIGETRESIVELLGEPIKEDVYSIIYKRPDKGYPVFIRIFLVDNKAEDVYFYRGDY